MRIAIFSTCPGGVYSGGRYHALIAGYCMARRGHEVYFITDNKPVFDDDLQVLSPDNPVTIVETSTFEIASNLRFDHVLIAPQMSRIRRLYVNAARLAKSCDAALSMICFETGNWFNAVSGKTRPLSSWAEWFITAARGGMILCSAEESKRHAEAFFPNRHPSTEFGVWQPAINSVACDAAEKAPGQPSILLFARPSDAHKGSDIVKQLMVPETKDHPFVIVIGNARGSEQYCQSLKALAQETGHEISFRFGLSDLEKFQELKRALVLVFPSQFEGYGYPPVEALATDTHCIAYDLPVIRENCGDLVHYVPQGDVRAMRDKLIELVTAGTPPATSNMDSVIYLTDLDVRAKALEETLEGYRASESSKYALSKDVLGKLKLGVSEPDVFFQKNECVFSFVMSCDYPIMATSCALTDGSVVPCQCVGTKTIANKLHHHVIVRVPADKSEGGSWPGGRLFLTFRGHSATTLLLPGGKARVVSPKSFEPGKIGFNQVFAGADGKIVFGWALLDQNFDSAVLISRGRHGTACVDGEVGLVNRGYKQRSKVSVDVSCGISFHFPSEKDLGHENTILFLHHGKVVAAMHVPSSELEQASDMVLQEIGRPMSAEEMPDALEAAPDIYRSKATASTDRSQFLGWTNAIDHPTKIEIRHFSGSDATGDAHSGDIATRLRTNVTRADVADNAGLHRADLGYFCALPPISEGDRYSVTLTSAGRELAVIERLRLDRDTEKLPHANSEHLKPSYVPEDGDDSIFVVRKPRKHAIAEFTFDPDKYQLRLKGWILTKGAGRVSLIDTETNTPIISHVEFVDRPDVARKFGQDYVKSGILLSVAVSRLSAGYALKIEDTGELFTLPSPKLENVVEFKVNDCRYDPVWRSIWVRGTFVCSGARASSVELWQKNQFLCTGTVNAKQLRHNEPRAGWRVEAILSEDVDLQEPIEVRLSTETGLGTRTSFHFKDLPVPPQADPLDDALSRLGPYGAIKKHFLPSDIDQSRIVLLVVHNLDAVDRPEKVKALAGLRRALRKEGLDLVVLHHCRNPVPGRVLPEINFFDPMFERLESLLGQGLSQDLRQKVPQEDLAEIIGALYGFYASQGFSPKSWKHCIEQVESEAQRLFVVLETLRPKQVLLWHQWNSLMSLGAKICDALEIPKAYLHEGMLPKTMTYDEQGMMAEASCVGARLEQGPSARDGKDEEWLSRADAVIGRIRTEGLDRKPLSDIRIGRKVQEIAEEKGAKLVFYAGINDWHSGNLPKSGGEIHSPHFKDTMDGLEALLSAAEAHGWLVMFKPHPNLYPRVMASHPNLVVVREVNTLDCIDAADAVATILSSIAYLSRVRGKPTVLMGRNTLSDSGSTYEVTSRDELPRVVDRALADTDRDAMEAAFRNHIAALLRDHLYAYDPDDTLAYLDHSVIANRIVSRDGNEVVELTSKRFRN